MTDDSQINLFRARLAETIAWCDARADAADPKNSLRSPELTPENWSLDSHGYDDYDWAYDKAKGWDYSLVSAMKIVDSISDRRSSLVAELNLRTASMPTNFSELGRLALMSIASNLSDGLSQDYSGGFYDIEEMPPWSTWLWVLGEHSNHTDQTYPVVLSWVPSLFVPMAQKGMDVNAMEASRLGRDPH